MPSGVYKITDIPEDKVATVVANFEVDSPENFEKIEQENGLWTVIATFSGTGESEETFTDSTGAG